MLTMAAHCAKSLLVLGIIVHNTAPVEWSSLRLPDEHIPYFFFSRKHLRNLCKTDTGCPYKDILKVKRCWGYETDCVESQQMSTPFCPEDGWSKSKQEQVKEFWTSADFGYVKKRLSELTPICRPQDDQNTSSLSCTRHTQYCRATDIHLDFTSADLRSSHNRFREDIFQSGGIGGHCVLDRKKLQSEGDHKSPLQSWFAELEHFQQLAFLPIVSGRCDVVLNKPTYLIKLDAGVNMFHHFCDFVNLYASQHINSSFATDVHIIMWDTSPMSYGDFFHVTWKAFTDHPIIHLNSFDGKRLCIRDAVFSLLPRMRFGLYYNMPLIPGCYGSGLMRSFSQHILYRLNVTQQGPLKSKVRVTLLTRDTKYRRILNQDELVEAVRRVDDLQVTVVNYNHKVPFLEQLQTTHNSDVFLGMHGAGLTHMLFQPDWAVIYELFNCDDKNCYSDLARLRGVKYMTWQRMDKLIQEDEGHHPTLGAHKKFTNYAFDVDEFVSQVTRAAQYVRSHPAYKTVWNTLYQTTAVPEKEL